MTTPPKLHHQPIIHLILNPTLDNPSVDPFHDDEDFALADLQGGPNDDPSLEWKETTVNNG